MQVLRISIIPIRDTLLKFGTENMSMHSYCKSFLQLFRLSGNESQPTRLVDVVYIRFVHSQCFCGCEARFSRSKLTLIFFHFKRANIPLRFSSRRPFTALCWGLQLDRTGSEAYPDFSGLFAMPNSLYYNRNFSSLYNRENEIWNHVFQSLFYRVFQNFLTGFQATKYAKKFQ